MRALLTTSRSRQSGRAGARLLAVLSGVALVAAVAALVAVSAGGVQTAGEPPGDAGLITADQLGAYLRFIAADELEGRRTPSRGLDIAALFLATNLDRWGLVPGGDGGTYFQMIELDATRVDAGASFVEVGGRRFAFGDGFLAAAIAGAGAGELVYAGHGWVVPAHGIDPYAALDVRGKVVVVTGSPPPELSRADLAGPGSEGVRRPGEALLEHGALALMTLPDERALRRWERSARTAAERGSMRVVGLDPREEPAVPSITASPELAEALLAGAPVGPQQALAAADGGDPGAPFARPETVVSFRVAVERETQWTRNVVAIAEGSDPALRDEYVAVGAHYDHVGVGAPVDGDAIYNGADDDGSGTVATLAIAEALAKGERPRRSVLLVWHAGEEVGLWGSRYVNERPPVPPEQIVAQLNIDMIGRSRAAGDATPANRDLTGPDEVYVIGPTVMSDELGDVVHAVNDAYLALELNPLYDAVDHPSRFFFRSDHVNYARNGIPVAFFFSGTHEDYHRPSDHADRIDYGKLERVTRTIYAIALELGNRDGRPALNAELPPEIRR